MIASELIANALRLINVPGRGATLQGDALGEAFSTLQEILNSNAASRVFVPGIRTHFFSLPSDRAIFNYGSGPEFALRSDDFNDDPSPVKIESAYIRQGGSITNNEEVDEFRFENVGNWVETAGASIANNQTLLSGIGDITQTLGLVDGNTYTLTFSAIVTSGDVVVQVQGDAVDVLNQTVTDSGDYSFDFVFSGTASTLSFTTDLATDDIIITQASIIERGKERLVLQDGTGSDYKMKIIDQTTYNRIFSKGDGGRPYLMLYSRSYPSPTIYFDNRPSAGLILVMDVLTNRVSVSGVGSTLRLNEEEILWLKYELADHLAGEYGKMLSPRQIRLKDEAWGMLEAANRRPNKLRIDSALRQRKRGFDIDRGDP